MFFLMVIYDISLKMKVFYMQEHRHSTVLSNVMQVKGIFRLPIF